MHSTYYSYGVYMSKVFTFFLLASVFCLTGCLDSETRIKVQPDGSGHVVETMKFSKKAIAFLKNLRSKEEKQEKPFSLFDEEELREKASRYGEGVSYVSSKEIKEDGMEGYTVTYAFTDINKLLISKNSLKKNLQGNKGAVDSEEGEQGEQEEDPSDKFSFSFTKGSPSTLVCSLLSKQEKDDNSVEIDETDNEKDEDASEMAMAMLKPFMEGMKVRFLVEPQGTIVKTNATFVEGSTITLMAIDLDEVFKNEEKTKQFFKEGNPRDKKTNWNEIIKDIPGVKGQVGEIQVQFK